MKSHREVEKLTASLRQAENGDALAAAVPPLDAAAGDTEKAAWVRAVVGLFGALPESEVQEIRARCRCDEEGKLGEMKRWLKAVWSESASLADFVDRMNALGAGWYLDDGRLYTKFLTCECYMLKQVETLPDRTWCHCTMGYTRNLFEHVFGRPMEAEVTRTIKTSHPYCLVAVWPKDGTW